MDSSFSPKDEIWFLRVCHHISNAVYSNITLFNIKRMGHCVADCKKEWDRADAAGAVWSSGSLRINGHCCCMKNACAISLSNSTPHTLWNSFPHFHTYYSSRNDITRLIETGHYTYYYWLHGAIFLYMLIVAHLEKKFLTFMKQRRMR